MLASERNKHPQRTIMETINQYQHVRLRPGMYGLHDNYFNKIFHQCILDLLQEFSFTTLKISTVPERYEVIFEASEREKYHASNNYWSFILIAGISSFVKFSAEFKDGSFRRTIIKEAEPCEETFGIYHSHGRPDESSGFYPNTDLEHLELRFILPKEYPIDENYARSKVHDLSKIFPKSRITYNGHEYDGHRNRNKNKITSILQYVHVLIEPARKIYEFSNDSEKISWEVSFTFDYAEKRRISFINGIRTARGGRHADCITQAIEQVFRKTETHYATQSYRHVGIDCEVEVDLHGVGGNGNPSRARIHDGEIRSQQSIHLSTNHIGNQYLFG